jgi:hypothetical protein
MARQIAPWLGEPKITMLEARLRLAENRLLALEALTQELQAKLAALTETTMVESAAG